MSNLVPGLRRWARVRSGSGGVRDGSATREARARTKRRRLPADAAGDPAARPAGRHPYRGVCIGLAVRDAAMLVAGAPARLRRGPALLLWLELVAAPAATALGFRSAVDEEAAGRAATTPPDQLEAARRAAVGALFGLHTTRFRVANAYLVTIPDGLMLVDSGMPGSAKRVLASIERLSRQPRELRSIVLTHCDIDHAGSAAELKRLTGVHVAIHALDAPVLSGKQRPQKGGRAMRLLSRLFRLQPVTPDVLLQDGDTIGGFRVLHVPGTRQAASPCIETTASCSPAMRC